MKWAASALAGLLLAGWIASGSMCYSWELQDWTMVTLVHGRIEILSSRDVMMERLVSFPDPYLPGELRWRPWHLSMGFIPEKQSYQPTPVAVIPLWPPLLLVALPAAYLWRRDWLASRRARIGLCVNCDYDRTGLDPAAACPECGQKAL